MQVTEWLLYSSNINGLLNAGNGMVIIAQTLTDQYSAGNGRAIIQLKTLAGNGMVIIQLKR